MEHKNLCLSVGSKMATDVSDAIDELPVTGNLKVYMGMVCAVSLLTAIKRVVGQARYDALIEMIKSDIRSAYGRCAKNGWHDGAGSA